MYHFQARMSFLVGILVGILVAVLVHQSKTFKPHHVTNRKQANDSSDPWLESKGVHPLVIPLDVLRYGTNTNHTLLSQFLFDQISVLCVLTASKRGGTKAALDTWARGCNDVVTVEFPGARPRMPMKKTPENSNWAVLCRALLDLPERFQWVVFVDEPSFVIMENLRIFLAPKDHSRGHYLGHAVSFWNVRYNKRKAGYVLSRGALRELKASLNDSCEAELSFLNREDFYLGKHLSLLNIFPEDTRDPAGLSRFHIYSWYHEFFPGVNYHKASLFPVVCCSPRAITFQAIEGDKMYMFYYLLYQLQVFTSGKLGSKPAPVPKEEVWRTFLNGQGIYHDVSQDEYYRIWEEIVQNPLIFGSQFRPDY